MSIKNVPLDQWSDGQLKMEVASLLDTPGYFLMSDYERAQQGYPASRKEREDFIAASLRDKPEGWETQ